MQLPMTGSWLVEVKAVRPFSIHGDIYWELQVLRLDELARGDAGQAAVLRLPQHAVKSEPLCGQKLRVSFLMGQVTSATIAA